MPRIKFNFSGWINGADIDEVVDADHNPVDVSKMDTKTFISKLKAGDLFISLGDYLYAGMDRVR